MKQIIDLIDKTVMSLGRRASERPWLMIGSAMLLMMCAHLFNNDTSKSYVMPVHLTLPSSTPQLELPSLPQLKWHALKIKQGDSLSHIFARLGLSANLPILMLKTLQAKHALQQLRPGKTVRIATHPDHSFAELQYPLNLTQRLIITRHNGSFDTHIAKRSLESRLEYIGATIRSNLYNAAHRAALSERLAMQLAKIFAWDVKFSHQIRPGDQFNILYKTYYAHGKKVHNGDIVAATLINRGKTYSAIRYIDKQGNVAYYTPAGKNLQKALSRHPLQHARISSPFFLHRWHPILHRYRAHKGVDYAAPWGTPIPAAGDGKVVKIGRGPGYGNYIKIKHDETYLTVYGHMSRFAKHIHRGQRVRKGEIIGYVGSTGLATGPHLHFEIRVHNKPRNPLTVAIPRAYAIAKSHLMAFKAKAKQLLKRIKLHQVTQQPPFSLS